MMWPVSELNLFLLCIEVLCFLPFLSHVESNKVYRIIYSLVYLSSNTLIDCLIMFYDNFNFLKPNTFQSVFEHGHSLKKLYVNLLVEVSLTSQSQILSNCIEAGYFYVNIQIHKSLIEVVMYYSNQSFYSLQMKNFYIILKTTCHRCLSYYYCQNG